MDKPIPEVNALNQTPLYIRLAHRLRISLPILMLLLAISLETIEEIQGTHPHFGPGGPHEGFYLEVFTYGILGPTLVGLGFHWIVKIVEQLEAARASEQKLRIKLEAQSGARRKLLANTIRSQEAERQRVARELHDGIGQPLTAFLLTSDMESIKLDDNPVLQHARHAASETIEAMRRLILDLRPALLDKQGLVSALRQCANNTLSPAGIEVTVTAVGQPLPIPDEAETALFRIGQEAFTNILRHAEASTVTSHIKFTNEQIAFHVQDNGKGIDLQSKNGESKGLGLGLLSMKERAEQIGGILELESQPDHGTHITVKIPVTSQGKIVHEANSNHHSR